MTRRMERVAVGAFLAGLLLATGGCDQVTGRRGVTPPPNELVDYSKKSATPEGIEKIKVSIKNLTFDKEGRTLAAAKNLGEAGADAAIAIPELRRLIAVKTDPETNFPSDRQREAYQKALDAITADMEKKGIAVPAETAGDAKKGEEKK